MSTIVTNFGTGSNEIGFNQPCKSEDAFGTCWKGNDSCPSGFEKHGSFSTTLGHDLAYCYYPAATVIQKYYPDVYPALASAEWTQTGFGCSGCAGSPTDLSSSPYAKIKAVWTVEKLYNLANSNTNVFDYLGTYCGASDDQVATLKQDFCMYSAQKGLYPAFCKAYCSADPSKCTNIVSTLCTGDLLNTSTCTGLCFTDVYNCDPAYKQYCAIDGNKNKAVCQCYLPGSDYTAFYNKTLDKLPADLRALVDSKYTTPVCSYPKCRSQPTYFPYKQSIGDCPPIDIQACVQQIKTDIGGSSIGGNININANCELICDNGKCPIGFSCDKNKCIKDPTPTPNPSPSPTPSPSPSPSPDPSPDSPPDSPTDSPTTMSTRTIIIISAAAVLVLLLLTLLIFLM